MRGRRVSGWMRLCMVVSVVFALAWSGWPADAEGYDLEGGDADVLGGLPAGGPGSSARGLLHQASVQGSGSVASGGFSTVSAAGDHWCELRTDWSIICWGPNPYRLSEDAPSGSFTAVVVGYGNYSVSSNYSCGLRTDGTVTCWGSNSSGQTDAPSGMFTAITAGAFHACGLRADGSIICWGNSIHSQLDPPPGKFTAVSAGWNTSCGLRTDGSVVCWGSHSNGAPSGMFTGVYAADDHACGLRTDGLAVCWGRTTKVEAHTPRWAPTAASTGRDLSCRLRTDSSVLCWPGPVFSIAVPDSGPGEGEPAEDAGVHQPAVDALRQHVRGIFSGTGCDEGLCAHEPLPRWEMAVWLVRVLDRADPPWQPTTRFDDVDNLLWWAQHPDRLAQLEVTEGCATEPLRFCPDRAVTRGQMATFLVRAFGLETAGTAGFADTEGHTHEANIDALASAGITAGCATAPLRYCPDQPVTRGQMATFLARTLGLV